MKLGSAVFLSLFLYPAPLGAQDAAVRLLASPVGAVTESDSIGEHPVRLDLLERSADATILIARDALQSEDYAEVKRFIVAVHKDNGPSVVIRLATLQSGSISAPSGPFRRAPELQVALRTTASDSSDTASSTSASTEKILADLAGGLAQSADVPAGWRYVIVAGRFSAMSPYASAWLLRRFLALRTSLIFWGPSGSAAPGSIEMLARATGGVVCATAADVGHLFRDPYQLHALTWDHAAPSKGFDLRDARIAGLGDALTIPFIAAASPELPDLPRYAELEAAVGKAPATADRVRKALAINPADRRALKLGIALAADSSDPREEIALLETAVEVDPRNAALWARLGHLRFESKSTDAAEVALAKAYDLGSPNAAVSEELGRIQVEKRNPSRALEFIDASLHLDGSRQPLWFLAADLAKQLGQKQKQSDSLERGLALKDDLARQTELIGLYLAAGNATAASRQVDLEAAKLPGDPDTQSTWAHFYEQLSRPDDALACWKRVVAADAKREPAHYAIATIYSAKGKWSDALEAAEHGLDADGSSARLHLIRASSLERLDRIYDARRSLDAFAPASSDLAVLKHAAELSDTFGGDAPAAYRRYAEALRNSGAGSEEITAALRRGLIVSLREGDLKNADWFRVNASPKPKNDASAPPAAPAKQTGVWIPGGIDALSFIAQGHQGASPDRFLADYCRTLLAHQELHDGKESVEYRKSIATYFEQLQKLVSLSRRDGNHTVLALNLGTKQGRQQAETVLDVLGWKQRRVKDKIVIESSEKASESRKQDFAPALGIDQESMRQAFEKGGEFRVEIPFDYVPVTLGIDAWRTTAQPDRFSGGIAEALSQSPNLAETYLGLSSMDSATAGIMAFDIGLPTIAGKYSPLLARYASALAIANGHVLTPGGTRAESVWNSLSGVSPADPPRFIRALFNKDGGKLLGWFFLLSQLDLEHQRFFTLNSRRTDQFYRAFTQSQELQTGAGRLTVNGSFGEFLREIPLTGESVDFPGSAEVWMVAKGSSSTVDQQKRLLGKIRKTAPPEVEDEVLLRLAQTKFHSDGGSISEVENFLAVVRIDAQREDPLDVESALILAQNYSEFRNVFPYFGVFLKLTAADFRTIFDLLGRMKNGNAVEDEIALGQFYALLELNKLALDSGGLSEDEAARSVRALSQRFAAGQDFAAYTAAAFDSTRELAGSNADARLEKLALGSVPPVEVEWNGDTRMVDPQRAREDAYRRVLELQRPPSVTALLRMDDAVRRIAAAKEPYPPLLDALQKDFASLPVVEPPKVMKFSGAAHESILLTNPSKIGGAIADLRQKTSKKKVNPSDLKKPCREILEELAPQLKVALAGVIYAAYLHPDDILVSSDPLLLRKHQSFELGSDLGRRSKFPLSDLVRGNSGEGSFFLGGYGQFAAAAQTGSAGGDATANGDLYQSQMAAIRSTPWARYKDDAQLLLGLRLRMAREWCIYAADNPEALAALADETAGILSLGRRRDLLTAVGSKSWDRVWESTTLSDLLFLSDRYLARYPKAAWNSPVDAALRQAESKTSSDTLQILGPVHTKLIGSNQPRLPRLAPYEEYERHLFPTEIAERASEIKLYIASALDRYAVPAAAIPAVAEPVAKRAFGSMKMLDSRDWASAIRAFRTIDQKAIAAALEDSK
ncbi:MAG TPA: hypothetical protein VKB79_01630 [Bryobacteraceae bacterium]|nr:hypothetical protein [Bryobacteraceae bacterium]